MASADATAARGTNFAAMAEIALRVDAKVTVPPIVDLSIRLVGIAAPGAAAMALVCDSGYWDQVDGTLPSIMSLQDRIASATAMLPPLLGSFVVIYCVMAVVGIGARLTRTMSSILRAKDHSPTIAPSRFRRSIGAVVIALLRPQCIILLQVLCIFFVVARQINNSERITLSLLTILMFILSLRIELALGLAGRSSLPRLAELTVSVLLATYASGALLGLMVVGPQPKLAHRLLLTSNEVIQPVYLIQSLDQGLYFLEPGGKTRLLPWSQIREVSKDAYVTWSKQ